MEIGWGTLFLTKNQHLKLRILSELVKEHHVSPGFIENTFNITKRVAKSIMLELENEIHEYNSDEEFQLSFKNNFYTIGPVFDSKKYNRMYSSIRSNYYKNSSLFSVLIFMLERRVTTLNSLSLELAYSQSYLYKLIDTLNDSFEKRNVSIRIEKSESSIVLTGKESGIRLAYYYACIYGYGLTEWPFKDYSKEKIENLQKYINYSRGKKISQSNELKRSLIDTIYLKSILKNQHIDVFDKTVDSIYSILIQGFNTKPLVSYLLSNTSFNKEEIDSEVCHLIFFLNYIIPELFSIEEKNEYGKKFLEIEDNNIINLSREVIKIIPPEAFSNENNKYYFIYELTIRFVIFKYYDVWKFSPEVSTTKLPLKWQETFSEELKNIYINDLSEKQLDSFVRQVVEVSSPFILSVKSTPIKIYTEFTYKSAYKLILDSSLNMYYNKSAIEIVSTVEQADIIVSDSLPLIETEADFFYFSDIYTRQNWEELNFFLQRKLLQKGFPTI